MTQAAELNQVYLKTGIHFEADRLTVDLAEPRTVLVHGVNARTGETKNYLLRVTQSGKLVLQ
jgi:hypothetical protein